MGRTAGAAGTVLQRGKGYAAQVPVETNPTHSTVRLGPTNLERSLTQGGRHHQYVRSSRQSRVGLAVPAVEVDGAVLDQAFEDLELLGQMSQRRAEVGAEDSLHSHFVSGADPEAEAPGRR